MRRHLKAVFVVAALCSFFAIWVSPAIADHGVVGSFANNGGGPGGQGSGNGAISNANQIDVNDATGNLYVADTGNNRVEVFKPVGESAVYDSQLALTAPIGLAIDQDTGNVYVSTATGISKFTAALTPAGGWSDPGVGGPLAVDPATGDVLVADTAGNLVRRFNSDGSADGSFVAERPVDLAANSSGDIFVVTTEGNIADYPCGTGSAVERFSGAGVSEGELAGLTVPGSVAVDPDDDTIAVGNKINEYFCEASNPPEVVFFEADGSLLEATKLPATTYWAAVPGLAAQGDGADRVYALTRSPMNDSYGETGIHVLKDVVVPVATVAPATGVAPFSATLHGSVNPEGFETACRFEYSTSELFFPNSVPCTPSPGSGTSPVAISANLSRLSTDTTYYFRVVGVSHGGAAVGRSPIESFTTTHADPPAVTLAAPSAITGTSAQLSGTVDPFGHLTTYRFEYRLAGASTWSIVGGGSAGGGTGPVVREATLKGLLPSSQYEVRLSASNGAGTTSSTPDSFPTLASAPVVQTLPAGQVSQTSAMLKASVDPAGEATTYYFEWGLDASYGNQLPLGGPASAGSSNGANLQTAALSGLQPGVVYHYRVVAENATGASTGDDSSFMTATTPAGCANEPIRERQGMQYLPDCRAFELVSPAQKYGNDIITPDTGSYNNGDFAPTAGVSGDQVAFTSHGPFAEAKSHPVFSVYRAVRGANGWSTQSLVPYLDGSRYSSPAMFFARFNDDLSSWFVLGPPGTQMTPDASEGTANAFFWDGQDSAYHLVSQGTPPESSVNMGFGGWSENQDTILFDYYGGTPLTADAPAGADSVLYQWNAGTEELSLVGKRPGTNLPFDSQTEIANPNPDGSAGPSAVEWNPVSNDGSKVYFYAPERPDQQLYLRLNGTETVHLSASQASAPDPNGTQPARFHYASVDGTTAFFSSPEKLTDDATTGAASDGNDLYRYDVASEELTDITVDPGDPDGAEVQGVIGGSDDGETVYFVARGVLAEGAVAGEDNLYRWTDDGSAKGALEFVSIGVDFANWYRTVYPESRRLARVTADGMHVLFQSAKRVSSYDNAGQREVYVYDAGSDEVTCASCNPSGAPATTGALALGSGDDQSSARLLSEDGRFAFFNTTEALVPTDVNNRMDAYQYDAERNRVDLITTGTSEYPAEFVDASADGSNVFVTTRQKLLSIDFDDNVDVYTARTGGGFLSQSPPPPPVPCFGEACRTEPLIPPAASNPASSTLNGKGNVKEKRKNNKKQKKKKQKKKHKNKSKQKKGKAKKQGGRR